MASEEQIQQWADEAEAGYDVNALKRRGRGRPGRTDEPQARRWSPGRIPVEGYSSTMVDTTAIEAIGIDESTSVAVLQAVADPIRWTILHTLAAQSYCVCHLQEHVPIAGNLLSYHLKVLREAGLVTSAKRGRWVDYALADDAPARMRAALPDAWAAPARGASADVAHVPVVSS